MSIKGLWDYLPFKLTLCFGAVLAFICSVIILTEDVFTKNIHFCGASDCFDRFIDLFALPIDIVKATAALLAIVALVHKSEETQEQIRITTMQNKYSNFYSHRKTIKEELNEKLNLNNLLVLSDFNRFYRVFFLKILLRILILRLMRLFCLKCIKVLLPHFLKKVLFRKCIKIQLKLVNTFTLVKLILNIK